MKKLLLIIPLLVVMGCASLENNAYHTIGTVTTIVDTAMQAWADYVNSGKATAAQVDVVHSAYNKYYVSMQTLRQVVIEYKHATVPDQAGLTASISAVTAASADVTGLIMQFLPPDKAAEVKGTK